MQLGSEFACFPGEEFNKQVSESCHFIKYFQKTKAKQAFTQPEPEHNPQSQ